MIQLKPIILFLCTGNSARSQMAEALLRHYAGGRYDAHSAGTEPKGLNPFTVRAMAELGIDVSQQRSKHVNAYLGEPRVKLVITVCGAADASCPAVWPGGAPKLSWLFDDPAACTGTDEEKLACFRRVRDQIAQRLRMWLAEQTGSADREQPW
jgi:arsenate reductase